MSGLKSRPGAGWVSKLSRSSPCNGGGSRSLWLEENESGAASLLSSDFSLLSNLEGDFEMSISSADERLSVSCLTGKGNVTELLDERGGGSLLISGNGGGGPVNQGRGGGGLDMTEGPGGGTLRGN